MPNATTAAPSLEAYYEGEDQQSKVVFEFVLHGIFLNLIGLVGLIGNGICIFILTRPQMKGSTNLILCALASFDTVVIVTSILMLSLPAVYRFTPATWLFRAYYEDVFPYIIPSVYALGLVAQTGSVYSTLCVTIERYIVICWPLRSSEIITYGRTKQAILIIFVFAFSYNLSRFFEITWSHVPVDASAGNGSDIAGNALSQSLVAENSSDVLANADTLSRGLATTAPPPAIAFANTTRLDIVTTDMRQDPLYISIYITWLYLVFMYAVPFTGLSALNLLIFLDVRRSNDRQVTLSSSQRKEMKLAVMLMIVVLVFLICNVLPLIVNIMELFGISYKPLTEISNLLVTVNSSCNIFIYTIFGEKFQRQLCKSFQKQLSWFRRNSCCSCRDSCGLEPDDGRGLYTKSYYSQHHLSARESKHLKQESKHLNSNQVQLEMAQRTPATPDIVVSCTRHSRPEDTATSHFIGEDAKLLPGSSGRDGEAKKCCVIQAVNEDGLSMRAPTEV